MDHNRRTNRIPVTAEAFMDGQRTTRVPVTAEALTKAIRRSLRDESKVQVRLTDPRRSG
jgi:hypothetical protein